MAGRQGGNLLMAHNTGMQPMPASGQSRTAIDGRDYLLVERQSSTMGLQMMVGIPLRQFYRDLLPMIQVVLLYSVIGLALALGLSIIFSLAGGFLHERIGPNRRRNGKRRLSRCEKKSPS